MAWTTPITASDAPVTARWPHASGDRTPCTAATAAVRANIPATKASSGRPEGKSTGISPVAASSKAL